MCLSFLELLGGLLDNVLPEASIVVLENFSVHMSNDTLKQVIGRNSILDHNCSRILLLDFCANDKVSIRNIIFKHLPSVSILQSIVFTVILSDLQLHVLDQMAGDAWLGC